MGALVLVFLLALLWRPFRQTVGFLATLLMVLSVGACVYLMR